MKASNVTGPKLPTEILEVVLKKLPVGDLAAAARVDKQWREAAQPALSKLRGVHAKAFASIAPRPKAPDVWDNLDFAMLDAAFAPLCALVEAEMVLSHVIRRAESNISARLYSPSGTKVVHALARATQWSAKVGLILVGAGPATCAELLSLPLGPCVVMTYNAICSRIKTAHRKRKDHQDRKLISQLAMALAQSDLPHAEKLLAQMKLSSPHLKSQELSWHEMAAAVGAQPHGAPLVRAFVAQHMARVMMKEDA